MASIRRRGNGHPLLANKFIKNGQEVHIAYFKYETYGMHPYLSPNIKEHHIEGCICDEYTSNDVQDNYGINDRICKIINDENINIVINQWWPLSYIKEIKKRTGAKVIWCLHTIFAQPFEKPHVPIKWLKYTLFPKHYQNRLLHNAANKVNIVMPYVDKYVFLSQEYSRQYLSYMKDANSSKICAIHNPISIKDEKSEMDICDKENIVLVVGRMQEDCKKYSSVLKVWHQIEHSNTTFAKSWRLIMVGDGESLAEYKELSQELGLKRITFEGYKNPIPYYKKAKIFLMTSRVEGFPVVAIEAQQMGVVPVVMESFPAIRDIVKHKYNGLLVPKDNIKQMRNSVLFLMKDEQYLQTLSKNGKISSQQFDIDNIIIQWNNLFAELQQ